MRLSRQCRHMAGGLALALGVLACPGIASMAMAQQASAVQDEPVKVVYHINDSHAQALAALRSMRNHLDTAPDTQLVVVTHADGIDFLTTEYDDAQDVGPLVAALAARGVRFEVCEITMQRKALDEDDFMLEAEFTPSGVVRIAQLQAREGYAYIKP